MAKAAHEERLRAGGAGRTACALATLLLLLALTISFSPGLSAGLRRRQSSGATSPPPPEPPAEPREELRPEPAEPREELRPEPAEPSEEPPLQESSCRSRTEAAARRRRPSPYTPSPYLLQRLREYEALHRRCGPHTLLYNRTVAVLSGSGDNAAAPPECKYVLWTPTWGIGNRILSLASSFLFALLSGRVLLIDHAPDFGDLMCEPFPGTSWRLPRDFPVENLRSFIVGDARSYASLLLHKKVATDSITHGVPGAAAPPLVYVHLVSNYRVFDTFFFCEEDQLFLRQVPWLLFKSDNYFVPGLFLNALYAAELGFLFPEKAAVFHLLCNYLFQPSDKVWDVIAAYYDAHLASADERVGVQIRIFNHTAAPFEVVLKQLLNCTQQEGLLLGRPGENKSRAVLVTSLYSGYLEGMERTHGGPNNTNGLMTFHQPSSEGKQVFGNEGHDVKAWAEIYLLGLCDVLITSAQSTFGYVGQAFAGTMPWILIKPKNAVVPEPACVREVSLEPCFHSPPPYICRDKKMGDPGKVEPYLVHCIDVPEGVKLVDQTGSSGLL